MTDFQMYLKFKKVVSFQASEIDVVNYFNDHVQNFRTKHYMKDFTIYVKI